MVVPLSPGELAAKVDAIQRHQSQKDRPLFPGADAREFWQRALARNQARRAAPRGPSRAGAPRCPWWRKRGAQQQLGVWELAATRRRTLQSSSEQPFSQGTQTLRHVIMRV